LSLRSMVASSSAAVSQTRTMTCKTVLTHCLFFFAHQGTNTDKFWSLLNSGCCLDASFLSVCSCQCRLSIIYRLDV
jgi:hypothetical protein